MVVLRARGHWPSWATVRRLAPIGALFGVNLSFFFAGVTKTSIANAEFIGILAPLLVVPAGALLFRERIPWRALPWGLAALGGVALVLFNAPPRGNATWAGNGLIVCAILTWASYLLASRRVRPFVRVDEFMAVTSLVAGAVLLPIVALQGRLDAVPASGWPWLAVMTVLNGLVAHALLIAAQQRVNVGTISTMQVAQPALAAGWAFIFLDETLRWPQLVGMLVVICALLLYTQAAQRSVRVLAAPRSPAGERSAAATSSLPE
jgi:drug/metabolite transporter (DMT)-like permease